MKKIITSLILLIAIFALLFGTNLLDLGGKLIGNTFAIQEQAYVDGKIYLVKDGTIPFDTCGADCNDGSPLTTPGSDGLDNNRLVRAGDTVEYRMDVNVNGQDSTNVTSTVTLQNATFLEIPSKCLTDTTTPPVPSAKKSTLSSDKRVLTCNVGISVQGTTAYVSFMVRADYTFNDTDLNASLIVTGDSAISSAVQTAPKVEITATPVVDIINRANTSTKTDGTVEYNGAYKRDLCLIGTSANGGYNATTCATAGGVFGDVMVYMPTVKHAKTGSERLATHDLYLDYVFEYTAGHNGANNAVLVNCSKEAGTSNPISCSSVTSSALSKQLTITVPQLQDLGISTILELRTEWFIPKTDYTSPTVLSTSSIVRGKNLASDAFNSATWDPNSIMPSNVSNYNAQTEYQVTCTDPAQMSTCNNRFDLPLQYPPSGPFCDTLTAGKANHWNYCGQFGPGISAVTPGSKSFIQYNASHEYSGNEYMDSRVNLCGKVSIDNSGNKLFYFTGEPGGTESISPPGAWYYNTPGMIHNGDAIAGMIGFNKPPYGAAEQWFYHTYKPNATGIEVIGTLGTHALKPDNMNLTIQYSTVPFSGNVANDSERNANCVDDLDANPATNDWITYTGFGSVTSQVNYKDITRVRFLADAFNNPPNGWTAAYAATTYVEINSSKTILDNYCATRAGAGCVIPAYKTLSFTDNTGGGSFWGSNYHYINNTSTPTFTNVETDPATSTWLALNGQDLFKIIDAQYAIKKTGDKYLAEPGEEVTYTLSPTFTGVATETLTLTDVIDSRATPITSSIVVVPAVNDPALACPNLTLGSGITASFTGDTLNVTYTGAKAGCKMPKIQYKVLVDSNLSNADLVNTVTIDSPNNATMRADSEDPYPGDVTQRQSKFVVKVRSSGGLNITKEILSPDVDQTNRVLEYKLNYRNEMDVELGAQEYIEVFPYLGDEFNFQDRLGPSDFNGKVSFVSITDNDAQTETVMYTKQDPKLINQDPKCQSNDSGTAGVWDANGTTNISSTNQQGTDWALYCNSIDTPTVWCADYTSGGTCPASISEVTALKIANATPLPVNSTARSFTIKLQTHANHGGDIYWNSWSGRVVNIDLPVISNDVQSTVVEGTLGNKLWQDVDSDGVIDAGEPPMVNTCVKLEVDATDATWATNYPLINKTKLDAGVDGLYGTADDRTLVDITDASGNYLFEHLASAKYKVTVVFDPSTEPRCAGATSIPASVITQTYDYDDGKTTTPATLGSAVIDICSHYELKKDGSGNVILPVAHQYYDPSTGLTTTDTVTGLRVLQSIDNKANNDGNNNGNVLGGTDYSIRNCAESAATFLEDADFGFVPILELSGWVYHDNGYENVMADNLVTPGRERPIPNVTLTLKSGNTCTDIDPDGAGPLTATTTTTDATGYYEFLNLSQGIFCVVETQPTNYKDGGQVMGNEVGITTQTGTNVEPDTQKVTLVSLNIENITFLETGPNLSGWVYHDNGYENVGPDNTVTAGRERPIPSTTITLKQADCTTNYDYNDAQPGTNNTTQTSVTGAFSFMNLLPGTYCLVETQPVNYKDGADLIGSIGGTVGNDVLSAIVLTTVDSIDNTFLETGPNISGWVYHDNGYENVAADNVVTAGRERPIPMTTITLKQADCTTDYDYNGASAGTNNTNQTTSLGAFSFLNLLPGTFCLVETQPTGYKDGADIIGSIGGIVANDRLSAIVLNTTDSINNTFMETGPNLSGWVYHDNGYENVAADNIVTAGRERPIPSTTITLKQADCTTDYDYNDATAGTNNTNLTTSLGAFSFMNLLPGTYCLVETQPVNYKDGADLIGSVGGTVANDKLSAIVLSVVDSIDNTFLETGPNLSGWVYHDNGYENVFADDIVTAGRERPIPMTTITLKQADCTTDYDYNGATAGTNNTNQTSTLGAFSFMNLLAGTYCLVETQPAGYRDGADLIGSVGGTVANDRLSAIVLTVVDSIDNTFLETGPNLTGYVLFDNGIIKTPKDDKFDITQDAPIPNATVTLKKADCTTDYDYNGAQSGTNNTDLTSVAGYFSFLNLLPDTYCLKETQPTDYMDGADVIGSVGGTVANDQLSAIVLGITDSINNVFLEVKGTSKICVELVGYTAEEAADAMLEVKKPDGTIMKIKMSDLVNCEILGLVDGEYELTGTSIKTSKPISIKYAVKLTGYAKLTIKKDSLASTGSSLYLALIGSVIVSLSLLVRRYKTY